MAIDVDLRIGGQYHLAMRRRGGSGQIAVHGCFRDILPGRYLAYSWHWEGAFPGIRFRMVDEAGHVRPHIQIFVNSGIERDPGALLPRGARIMVVGALSGG